MLDVKVVLLKWFKFFDKKTSGGVIENEIISNKKLAEELLKPIIEKFAGKKYSHLFLTIFGVHI